MSGGVGNERNTNPSNEIFQQQQPSSTTTSSSITRYNNNNNDNDNDSTSSKHIEQLNAKIHNLQNILWGGLSVFLIFVFISSFFVCIHILLIPKYTLHTIIHTHTIAYYIIYTNTHTHTMRVCMPHYYLYMYVHAFIVCASIF